jgi:hypothetical protein
MIKWVFRFNHLWGGEVGIHFMNFFSKTTVLRGNPNYWPHAIPHRKKGKPLTDFLSSSICLSLLISVRRLSCSISASWCWNWRSSIFCLSSSLKGYINTPSVYILYKWKVCQIDKTPSFNHKLFQISNWDLSWSRVPWPCHRPTSWFTGNTPAIFYKNSKKWYFAPPHDQNSHYRPETESSLPQFTHIVIASLSLHTVLMNCIMTLTQIHTHWKGKMGHWNFTDRESIADMPDVRIW